MTFERHPLTSHAGNDPELDPNREPEPPTKAIDKPTARTGKRNAPTEAPARSAGAGATTTRAPKDSANANDNCALHLNMRLNFI